MKKTVTIAGGVLAAFLTLITGLVISFEITFQQRAYPGIRLANSDVGGMRQSQILDLLKKQEKNMENVSLKWGVNEWQVPLGTLGLEYAWESTTQQILSVGRSGDFLNRFKAKAAGLLGKINLEPVVKLDLAKIDEAIATISAQIDVPAMEPEIVKVGLPAKVLVSKGENGQEVNRDLLRERILVAVTGLKTNQIEIPVTDIRPELSDEQVNKATEQAEKLLGKTITVKFEEENQEWTVEDETLLTWMNLASEGWNHLKIKNWIDELAKTVDRPAQNATFRWVGENKVEEFRPAKPGIKVASEQMTAEIMDKLKALSELGTDQNVALLVEHAEPDITNGDVNNLGIKELIGKGESWFTGSITNRIFNLKKASDLLNGRLVAPGETFSFNEAVGEISSDTGYKQAYIIKEGKTILGDGGGVCQVSTVLFRAILNAGLPILARTPHAYRVSYYEVNYQPGFDATVFQPAPDFKFSNDTPAHILIQTVYDEANKYLAFEIYGTSDGRETEVSKTRIWEVIAPPPDLYIDDPNLPVGKVVQTEHAARGAKVAFDWKVTRNGEVLQERTFFSNYRPWQAVYLRGTKTQ